MGTQGPQSQQEPAWEPQTEEFSKHREQAWKDRQGNSDEFDKNLLTFSSGGLGLSLAFIKDIVPLAHAAWAGLLYVSWFCFVACITTTIFSYLPGIWSIDRHLGHLEKYYIKGNQEFLKPKNSWSNVVDAGRVIGGFFFLAGVVATVVFVWLNIPKGH